MLHTQISKIILQQYRPQPDGGAEQGSVAALRRHRLKIALSSRSTVAQRLGDALKRSLLMMVSIISTILTWRH
jgi:hypothetical protein